MFVWKKAGCCEYMGVSHTIKVEYNMLKEGNNRLHINDISLNPGVLAEESAEWK